MASNPAFHIGKRDSGGTLRRFTTPKPRGSRIVLRPDHPANANAETIFPSRVVHASVLQRVLKSGANASKIGKTVMKGKWRGYPIYTLTLEERATCPKTCQAWAFCYGNNMHLADRIIHDEAFEIKLIGELETLQDLHPDGFVVRLHVLGDFFSVEYVRLWRWALAEYPSLHVFGYTARDPDGAIGKLILDTALEQWSRFAVRFSGWGFTNMGAELLDETGQSKTGAVQCPAQTGKTDCCATCALCWQSERPIAFARH